MKLIKGYIRYSQIIRLGFVIICYIAVFVFSIIISLFLKFHINLIFENSTTIESLDVEHKADNAKFNLGKWQNWEQVFGSDPIFWFLPLPVKKGRPDGDGLSWKTKSQMSDSGFKSNESRNFININNAQFTNETK